MQLRCGVYEPLEQRADEMIVAMLERERGGRFKGHHGRDVITRWKQEQWEQRTVMVVSGMPDGALMRGLFNRCANDRQVWLNSRDGWARPTRGYVGDEDW